MRTPYPRIALSKPWVTTHADSFVDTMSTPLGHGLAMTHQGMSPSSQTHTTMNTNQPYMANLYDTPPTHRGGYGWFVSSLKRKGAGGRIRADKVAVDTHPAVPMWTPRDIHEAR